ncbi:hypothetical protein GCM10011519_22740 [Marmoricola endophyticus]|uniref:DNA-binding protein n=1 Tax=Marmoricola endophyticus TaxID=2040280 RepID=A0A917BJ91_9ACTN|nr:OB-fold domain-containing protein [Marmoricola endophyticus]GGF48208.1 hypothetical protein GCM10011519_22740 [Marmoricola endophyticus]
MSAPPAPEDHYRAGLEAGELRYQWCTDCAAPVFYPRVLCPGCGGTALEWRVSGGAGTVYSATVVRSRDGARGVVLVDLEEGFRMMSRVTGDPEAVAIGSAVTLRVDTSGEAAQAVFDPAGEPS